MNTPIEAEARGMIIAPAAGLKALNFPKNVFKVKSWDNRHSPKTVNAAYASIKNIGWCAESVYDNTHNAYRLFIYRDRAERQACFAKFLAD